MSYDCSATRRVISGGYSQHERSNVGLQTYLLCLQIEADARDLQERVAERYPSPVRVGGMPAHAPATRKRMGRRGATLDPKRRTKPMEASSMG